MGFFGEHPEISHPATIVKSRNRTRLPLLDTFRDDERETAGKLHQGLGRVTRPPRGVYRAFGGALGPVRYVPVGGPNQVVSASASPTWVRSPTQATYPSGRTKTAGGAGAAPDSRKPHPPTDFG